MKLLFLDIDGVLNSTAWFMAGHKHDRTIDELDPEACARLQSLCADTGAQIVVSSTWRLIYKLPALRSMLWARGVYATILGVTPSAPREDRGLEIQRWLDTTAAKHGDVEGIVILDDDSDMVHLFPWFVKTHNDRGLTDWECLLAKAVLESEPPARNLSTGVSQ